MSQTKTLKITPTGFHHQLIIIRGLFDPSSSYSQSGPETYASDALQPADLLCKPETPNVGRSRFCHQVSQRQDPSSERWRIFRKFA
jgi:hypothetical protein